MECILQFGSGSDSVKYRYRKIRNLLKIPFKTYRYLSFDGEVHEKNNFVQGTELNKSGKYKTTKFLPLSDTGVKLASAPQLLKGTNFKY
jgi:hypothetical protein